MEFDCRDSVRLGIGATMKSMRWALCAVMLAFAGCGKPKVPSVVLERPPDFPEVWEGHKLYNTPQAYIYASGDESAAMAEGVVKDVGKYVKRKHGKVLPKGLVIVAEPGDQPFAATLENVEAIEKNPELSIPTRRHPKTPAQVRRELADKGIPEGPMVRAGSMPLSEKELTARGLQTPSVAWTVVMPSRALAVESGTEAFTAALRKQKPELTETKAREAVAKHPDMTAKAFEINRGQPIFVVWVGQQADWSEAQRREAILAYVRSMLKSNWLPVPKDEALGW